MQQHPVFKLQTSRASTTAPINLLTTHFENFHNTRQYPLGYRPTFVPFVILETLIPHELYISLHDAYRPYIPYTAACQFTAQMHGCGEGRTVTTTLLHPIQHYRERYVADWLANFLDRSGAYPLFMHLVLFVLGE